MGEIGHGNISGSAFYHLLPGTGNQALKEDHQFYEDQIDKFLGDRDWTNDLKSSGFTTKEEQEDVTRRFVSALTYAGIGQNTASRETLSIVNNLAHNNLGAFNGTEGTPPISLQ